MSEPSEIVVTAWIRLVRAHHAALGAVERALKEAGLPPLAWYDVLFELERAGSDGLRPYELERALLLPQYGLSRLTDRVEAAGHIARKPVPQDGRGHRLVITRSGKALRRRIWRVYGPAIEASIGARLNPTETKALATLLAKLTDTPGSP